MRRGEGRRGRRAALAVLWLAAGLAGGEAAAETVRVAFDFGDYPSSTLADAEAVRRDVERRLARAMAKELPFWRFVPARGGAAGVEVRAEEVELTGAWELVVEVATAPGVQPEAPSRGVLLSIGELRERGGFVAEDRLAELVAERFRENLLDPAHLAPNQGELVAKLQKWLPVARRAHLPPGPSGVLALPWQSHQGLARSVFRIECRDSTSQVVELYSRGTGRCLPFPEQPPFEAVEVRHDRWQPPDLAAPVALPAEELARLVDLRPVSIYLEEQGATVDGACDPAAALPTVAPPGGAP